jgi:hypothetical protein
MMVPSAHAFYDSLAIVPATPAADQPYRFTVRSGGCHAIRGQEPLDYSVSGSTVALTLDVFDNSLGVGFCIFPIHTKEYLLPGLPPGSYRFELWQEPTFQQLPRQPVGAIDFDVTAGAPPPTAVPVGGSVGWLALAFSLVAAGLITARRRCSATVAG